MNAAQRRAIVLIDGEHQPSVVADEIARLGREQTVVAAAFVGGSEKVAASVFEDPVSIYGCPVVRADSPGGALLAAMREYRADVVIDLCDEPIAGPAEKVKLASLGLAHGLSYEAPGTTMTVPRMTTSNFTGPKIAVIGTAKRTGKTAVCGHLASLLAEAGAKPAIVSMGRGGPAEPQVALPPVTVDDLLAVASSGKHAASDYLEDAALAQVPTVGCRRVGGGFSGAVADTNFASGVELAAGIEGVDALLFEGSGSSVPPVDADRTVTVVGDAFQASELTGPARIALADLVLVRADDPRAVAEACKWTDVRTVGFRMVSESVGDVPASARVAVFTTGATQVEGVEAAFVSTNLARREALDADLNAARAADCDHYLIEVKAAAIDTVAVAARSVGAAISFIRNRPVSDEADLDELLLNVWREVPR